MIILRREKDGYYYANYQGVGYVFDNIDSAERFVNKCLGFKGKSIKIPLTKYTIIFLRNNNKISE